MHDALARLRTSQCEACSAHNIVEPTFAKDQQSRTRITGRSLGDVKVSEQLSVAETIIKLDLLLLCKCSTVDGVLLAALDRKSVV